MPGRPELRLDELRMQSRSCQSQIPVLGVADPHWQRVKVIKLRTTGCVDFDTSKMYDCMGMVSRS